MNVLREIGLFISRLFQITQVVFRLVFDRRPAPVRFRLFFERTGGAFIKLGQILSLRHDLLPPAYTDELLNLLARVEEAPFSAMSRVFEKEFGRPPSAAFKSFREQPLASASISQVYEAELPSGERVAVKIARPGVARIFETDFVLASFLAGLLGIFNFFDRLSLDDAVTEFIAWTRRELDFRIEAHNALVLHRHSLAHPRTVIPRVFPEWTRQTVMVSEYLLDIIPLDKLLVRQGEEKRIDFHSLAYYFISDLMRQYLIDGFFHADPHPANLFVVPDQPTGGRLGYFDFGIIGQIGSERVYLLRIVHGLAERDLLTVSRNFLHFARASFREELALLRNRDLAAYDRYTKIFEKIEEIIVDNLRLDLEKILKPWYEPKPMVAGRRRDYSSLAISRMIFKIKEYGVYLPKDVMIFFRTLVIAEMVAIRLEPNFDMARAFVGFFQEFPLAKAEQMIIDGSHEENLVGELDTTSHLTFEEFLEVKEMEKEKLAAAKEHLVELIGYYAEQYEEVRELLKE